MIQVDEQIFHWLVHASTLDLEGGSRFQPDKYKEVDSSTRSVYALPDITGKKHFEFVYLFYFATLFVAFTWGVSLIQGLQMNGYCMYIYIWMCYWWVQMCFIHCLITIRFDVFIVTLTSSRPNFADLRVPTTFTRLGMGVHVEMEGKVKTRSWIDGQIIVGTTLPETNGKSSENGWLEDDSFLLGRPIFSGDMLVSGRVIYTNDNKL